MFGGFQVGPFQTNFQQEGGAQPPAVEEAGPTPAGAVAKRVQRRRYIMPDGTLLIATTQEAFEWLRMYTQAAPEPAKAVTGSPREPAIRAPVVELAKRDVRFVPATDSIPDTWKAVVSERFTYRPPPEVTRQAQERLNRMRADDEAILALMLWS
jgi:hypothetical protein